MTDLSSVSSAATFTTPALVSSRLSHLNKHTHKPDHFRSYLLEYIFSVSLSQVLPIVIITFLVPYLLCEGNLFFVIG